MDDMGNKYTPEDQDGVNANNGGEQEAKQQETTSATGNEPKTPYQTPVHRPDYINKDEQQPYSRPQPQEQPRQYNQQYGQYRQNGQSQQYGQSGQYRYDNNDQSQQYGKYGQSQYNQSQQYYGKQQAPKPPKKKRSRAVTVLCSIAAACLLFAGGAVIGHLAFGGVDEGINSRLEIGSAFSDNGKDNSTASNDTGDSSNSNNPSVAITSKPDTEVYDSKDGMAGEDIYKKVSPSIVSVLSTSLDVSGSGSGVIMSEDGYIITNNHVVEGAQQVTAQLSDGTQLQAKIIGRDEKTDLAVLKVETDEKLTAAEFGDSDALQPGEYAYAIGSPGGVELANTITGGRISAINRDITIDDRVMTLIQTDASINPGNSGGALINKYGQVVGITSAKLSSAGFGSASYEGLGFAIPMSTAKAVVDELIANGYIAGRPSIGITGQNISAERAEASNLPQGVYVRSVDERSKAAAEGLQPGDIITKVDGQDITTMDEINAIKETKKAGDKLTIGIYRMSTGKMVDLTITLTDEHDLEDDNTQQETPQVPQRGDGGYSQYEEDPFSYFFGW